MCIAVCLYGAYLRGSDASGSLLICFLVFNSYFLLSVILFICQRYQIFLGPLKAPFLSVSTLTVIKYRVKNAS